MTLLEILDKLEVVYKFSCGYWLFFFCSPENGNQHVDSEYIRKQHVAGHNDGDKEVWGRAIRISRIGIATILFSFNEEKNS